MEKEYGNQLKMTMLQYMFAGKTIFFLKINFILLLNLFSDAKNMARDVHSILVDIAQTHGSMTSEKAAAFVKELTQKGRYSQDVWS